MLGTGLVIGIAGPAGAGKDTVANFIVDSMGFVKASFATPIKEMMSVLGLTYEQLHGDQKEVVDPRYGKTPRHMMQTLGTEWGRQMIRGDIWARALFVEIQRCSERFTHDTTTINYVVADVRFNNEARLLREKGGWIIHVEGRDAGVGSDHASEAGVEWHENDMVIDNSGELHELVNACQPIIERLHEEISE